ncbi:MAG: sigma-54-dependent Fis family transcriptional regulator [Desulfobacterales bacterium]|nr:sigma-54-dependent Fis family transcriptional regulator [Desulfobacterales bacterium]
MASILIFHDDDELINFLVELLKKNDFLSFDILRDRDTALLQIKKNPFALIITDFSLLDPNKNTIFGFVKKYSPYTEVIVFAKNTDIKDCVYSIKKGASNYLTKSLTEQEIFAGIKNAIENYERKRSEIAESLQFGDLIGKSPEIIKVFKTIKKVAKTDSTVLITGESGTGKELIARAIHFNSEKKEGPLIVINCGAIPGELLESELFGHEKGSFTGAHRTRIGRFEMAHGGTVFLDEIGDMSIHLQVKLLRVIQKQNFERVGGTKTIKVDSRIIAATNKDLALAIKEGTFREDLYYRLNVIPIKVPALRNRKEDIPILIDYFFSRLEERSREEECCRRVFSNESMEALKQYDWPGNIRELENMVERLSVLVDGNVINVEDLPDKITEISYDKTVAFDQKGDASILEKGIAFNEAIEKYERELILKALHHAKGVKAKAAELLKMNRTTLVEKIKKMKLEVPKEADIYAEFT